MSDERELRELASDFRKKPQKLAREATCFNTDLSFGGMYEALRTNDPERLEGTLEFTFGEAATFPYQCDFHPAEMLGEVTVTG